MLVQFTVFPAGHDDQAFDITERRFSTPDEAVGFWQKKYPPTEYDIDDIRWDDRRATRAYITGYIGGIKKEVELPVCSDMGYDEYARCLKKVYNRLKDRWPDAWLTAWLIDDQGNRRDMTDVWSIRYTTGCMAAYQERTWN